MGVFSEPSEQAAEVDPDQPDLAGADPTAAFAALFGRHAGRLFRYLAQRVGPGVAEDLLSETFTVALRQRHTYDPDRAPAGAWLFGIATNLARRHVRSEVRGLRAIARLAAANSATDAAEDGPAERIADRVDAGRRIAQLAAALAELPAGDRDVLLLTSWGGLSATEVAHALGIPAGTVRSRLHRVRRWLRAHAPIAEPPESPTTPAFRVSRADAKETRHA